MKVLIRSALFCFTFVFLASNPAGAVPLLNGSYTLLGTDPLMSPRLNRDGVTSDWGFVRTFPGEFSSGDFPYQLFGFNSGTNPFLQVTFGSQDLNANIQVALYTGLFDPANIGAGWLADSGTSTGTPASDMVFRFEGQLNTNYQILLFDTNEGLTSGGVCVEGFTEAASPRPSACAIDYQNILTPDGQVPAPATLALFGLGLAGLGWSRRKKA